MKTQINYKKIKRDLFLRDTHGDSRFITKTVKSKKTYTRKGRVISDDSSYL